MLTNIHYSSSNHQILIWVCLARFQVSKSELLYIPFFWDVMMLSWSEQCDDVSWSEQCPMFWGQHIPKNVRHYAHHIPKGQNIEARSCHTNWFSGAQYPPSTIPTVCSFLELTTEFFWFKSNSKNYSTQRRTRTLGGGSIFNRHTCVVARNVQLVEQTYLCGCV